LRAMISADTVVSRLGADLVFAGQAHSVASLLPTRFHSRDMTVPEMVFLAGCTIQMAHDADTMVIDGLDIATYLDATGRFELLSRDENMDRASEIDNAIRNCISKHQHVAP